MLLMIKLLYIFCAELFQLFFVGSRNTGDGKLSCLKKCICMQRNYRADFSHNCACQILGKQGFSPLIKINLLIIIALIF